jgi:hypothetical protein
LVAARWRISRRRCTFMNGDGRVQESLEQTARK